MGHGINERLGDNPLFVGQLPWHGLGNTLAAGTKLSAAEARDASNANFPVSTQSVLPMDSAKLELRMQGEHENYVAQLDQHNLDKFVKRIVRDDTGATLGVCGPQWTPLQNSDLFNWFQPFIDQNLATIETCGTLFGGEVVWVLAKVNIPNSVVVEGDEVSAYIMGSNRHNGRSAVRLGFTEIRVVCANTLAMAEGSSASKLLRIRHTKGVKESVDNLQDVINLATQEFEATAEQYRFLASKRYNQIDVLKYVQLLEVDASDANKPFAELTTRAKNRITDIAGLAVTGKGNGTDKVIGTWWAAYNAYTEYLNYGAGRNAENRLDNLWFGSGENKNQAALNLAVKMAGG